MIVSALLTCMAGWAQSSDALKAVTAAAKEITEAQKEDPKVEKPRYWTNSLVTNIKFGQTSLTNVSSWITDSYMHRQSRFFRRVMTVSILRASSDTRTPT